MGNTLKFCGLVIIVTNVNFLVLIDVPWLYKMLTLEVIGILQEFSALISITLYVPKIISK